MELGPSIDKNPANIREIQRDGTEGGGHSWCWELLRKGVEEERGWPERGRSSSQRLGGGGQLLSFLGLS